MVTPDAANLSSRWSLSRDFNFRYEVVLKCKMIIDLIEKKIQFAYDVIVLCRMVRSIPSLSHT